jgi:hypothetical protein
MKVPPPLLDSQPSPFPPPRVLSKNDRNRKLFAAGQQAIEAMARSYQINRGTALRLQTLCPINVTLLRRLAEYVHAARHEPEAPEVMRSYFVFRYEVLEQYRFLRDWGLVIERWDQPGQPYANSHAMLTDLWTNFHLSYFPTYGEHGEGGFGSSDAERRRAHPLLDTCWYDEQHCPVPYNDAFRIVHDVFGHGRYGWSFGLIGEERAWESHTRMFSPQAWMALAAETRAQTAWFHFGPHLRRPDGSFPRKGETDYLPLDRRPYVEQKALWLPLEFYTPPVDNEQPQRAMSR